MDVTLLVDALSPQLTGIGRYVWELCKRLPADPAITTLDYFSNGEFIAQPERLLDQPPQRRTRSRLPRWINRRLTERRLRCSLVHGPNFFLPREAESGVITVHDLSVFRYPETHPPERLRAFEREFQSSLQRARHVITDTETVRHELIDGLGIAANRVTAIPLGVDEAYRPRRADEIQGALEALGLQPGKYALCVSTLEPRKKIAELLGAWRDLPVQLRNSTPLVLAGAEGWLNDQLHRDIADAVAAGWLKHLAYVPEELLPTLYAGASLFLYPSIYEGFGLPPVEAMASGVPVLVSSRSCLPEVCGDAVAYVDPDDIAAFSKSIAAALEDSSWRTRARQAGLQRAAGYNWADCAARTAEIYRRCSI